MTLCSLVTLHNSLTILFYIVGLVIKCTVLYAEQLETLRYCAHEEYTRCRTWLRLSIVNLPGAVVHVMSISRRNKDNLLLADSHEYDAAMLCQYYMCGFAAYKRADILGCCRLGSAFTHRTEKISPWHTRCR